MISTRNGKLKHKSANDPGDASVTSFLKFSLKNLANVVSILGVLPMCILFQSDGYQYLIPLMIYGNVMDDLDGILAAKLNTKSDFGGRLDNVCDAIGHCILVMVVGANFGNVCLFASLIGAAAIVIRSVMRLDASQSAATGSPTNELIRHILFILVMAQSFGFDPAPFLTVSFLLHAASMLLPRSMPYLIRSMTKSPAAIGLVNVSLLVVWLVPVTAPLIGGLFIGSYLYSFAIALIRRPNQLGCDLARSKNLVVKK